MKLKEIHIKEVIKSLKRNDSYKYYRPRQAFLKDASIDIVQLSRGEYIKYAEKDKNYERIVAGYFLTDDVYFYLEKVKEFYVLTKRKWKNEIKVLLHEKRYKLFTLDMSFKEFKNFCWKMDYKKGLFSYSKEDIK